MGCALILIGKTRKTVKRATAIQQIVQDVAREEWYNVTIIVKFASPESGGHDRVSRVCTQSRLSRL